MHQLPFDKKYQFMKDIPKPDILKTGPFKINCIL